jgi:hypothetical protein
MIKRRVLYQEIPSRCASDQIAEKIETFPSGKAIRKKKIAKEKIQWEKKTKRRLK